MKVIYDEGIYQVYFLFDLQKTHDKKLGVLKIYYSEIDIPDNKFFFNLENFYDDYLDNPINMIISKDLKNGYCLARNLSNDYGYKRVSYKDTPLEENIIRPAMRYLGL